MAKSKPHNWKKFNDWRFKLNEENNGEKIEEAGQYNVSSKPFDAWKEHDSMNDKLFRDLHWAMKAFPNKKKEIKKLMKLSHESGQLIKILIGQAVDL